jgi:hypothetical protein
MSQDRTYLTHPRPRRFAYWISHGMRASRSAIIRVALCFSAVLAAQSRRSYGPGRVLVGSGPRCCFSAEEDYGNPDGLASVLNTSGAINPSGHAFFRSSRRESPSLCYMPLATERHESLRHPPCTSVGARRRAAIPYGSTCRAKIASISFIKTVTP